MTTAPPGLLRRFGLPPDSGLDEARERLNAALADAPDDLDLRMYAAELARRAGDNAASRGQLAHVQSRAQARADARHDGLSRGLMGQRRGLRAPWVAAVALIVAGCAGVGVAAWRLLDVDVIEPVVAADLELARWLAEQQATSLSNLRGADDVLVFPKVAEALELDAMMEALAGGSPIAPSGVGGISRSEYERLLEPWLGRGGALEGLPGGDHADPSGVPGPAPGWDGGDHDPLDPLGGPGSAGSEEVPAEFACSVEPMRCQASDVPSLPGESRNGLWRVVIPALRLLVLDGDCEGIARLVTTYGREAGWRATEAHTLGVLEVDAADCFVAQAKLEQADTHARKAICSGDHGAFNGYLTLAQAALKRDDREGARQRLGCAREFAEHFEEKYRDEVSVRRQASQQLSQVGATMWEWFGDRDAFGTLMARAREVLETIPEEARDLMVLRQAALLDENLLEAHVTGYGDDDAFVATSARLRSSDVIEPSYRVIVEALTAMRRLRQRAWPEAADALEAVVRRYEQLDEMNARWSWRGITTWLDSDRASGMADVNARLLSLVRALDGPRSEATLATLRELAAWAASQAGR